MVIGKFVSFTSFSDDRMNQFGHSQTLISPKTKISPMTINTVQNNIFQKKLSGKILLPESKQKNKLFSELETAGSTPSEFSMRKRGSPYTVGLFDNTDLFSSNNSIEETNENQESTIHSLKTIFGTNLNFLLKQEHKLKGPLLKIGSNYQLAYQIGENYFKELLASLEDPNIDCEKHRCRLFKRMTSIISMKLLFDLLMRFDGIVGDEPYVQRLLDEKFLFRLYNLSEKEFKNYYVEISDFLNKSVKKASASIKDFSLWVQALNKADSNVLKAIEVAENLTLKNFTITKSLSSNRNDESYQIKNVSANEYYRQKIFKNNIENFKKKQQQENELYINKRLSKISKSMQLNNKKVSFALMKKITKLSQCSMMICECDFLSLSEIQKNILKDNISIDLKEMTKKILQAVEVLHSNGISHNRLNVNNIMFDKNGDVKITDFKDATIVKKSASSQIFSTDLFSNLKNYPQLENLKNCSKLKETNASFKKDIEKIGYILAYFQIINLAQNGQTDLISDVLQITKEKNINMTDIERISNNFSVQNERRTKKDLNSKIEYESLKNFLSKMVCNSSNYSIGEALKDKYIMSKSI